MVRAWCFSAIVLVGFVLVLLAPTGQSFYYTRNDPRDEGYRWANLTWSGTGGGISWGAAAASAEASPASSTPTEIVFVSAPLDAPLFLNPAHLVQLDLMLRDKAGSTPQTPLLPFCRNGAEAIGVRLEADGVLVAGAVDPARFTYSTGPDEAQVTEGHTGCYYRMPIEADVLDAGAVLRLTITFRAQETFAISTSKEAPSVLLLPLFSRAEAAYRMPEVFPRLREADGASGAGTTFTRMFGIGFLGVGVLGLTLPRRGRRIGLAAALVFAGGFAGCLASPGPARDAAPDGSDPLADAGEASVNYESGDSSGSGNGSIFGRVADRYGFPVGGAFVVLLGTPRSQATSVDGIFEFGDVAPRDHRLRVDRETFRSIEVAVQVVAGKAARVDVVLAYDSSLGAAQRPHLHDYWNGEDSAILVEAPLFADCLGDRECHEYWQFFPRPGDDPFHNLVRPGTTEVEVVLEFDPANACSTRMGLAFQDNADPAIDNGSWLLPRKSGEPFRIQTTWESTDVGHQLFSTWTFTVYNDPDETRTCAADTIGGVTALVQPVKKEIIHKATVRIHRGALPLEPQHPDWWGTNDALPLVQTRTWSDYRGLPPFGPLFGTENFAACTQGSSGLGSEAYPDLGGADYVVPVGASAVTVYVNFTRLADPQEHLKAYRWQLWYKTGETQPEPFVAPREPFKQAPDPVISADHRHYVWKIPVSGLEADGIYNKRSAWRFALVPDDLMQRCLDQYQGGQAIVTAWTLAWEASVART